MPETSSPGSSLVILAAPSGLLAGVRDVLQDWSGVGLVSPFCWVENPSADGPGQAVSLDITDGRATPERLASLMATREMSRIRLCVLVPEFERAPALDQQTERALAQLIRVNKGSTVAQEYLRLIITRPGCWPGESPLSAEAWHNVVISPEESQGPAMGHEQLRPTDDPFEVGPPAAAAICSLAGLWTGIDEGPLDGKPFLPAGYVRVARSFFRYLDADAVDTQMRDGVLAMSGGLPLPMVGTIRAVPVEDVALATGGMADQLWTKHAAVLLGPRDELPPVTRIKVSAGQLIKYFFAFLGSALRNAPQAFAQALFRQAASGLAAALQNRILGGANSAYLVVVKGVRADGMPADWQDLAPAATQLNELLSDPNNRMQHEATRSLGHVWRDYVAATLTLADAGTRSPQLPPVAIGTQRGVLPRAADCAPGPGSDFTDVPEGLRSVIGFRPLPAADVLGIDAARARLERAQADAAYGPDASRAYGALARWAAEHRPSFALQSAARLGRALMDRRDEVRGLIEALIRAGQELEPNDDFARRQRRLAIIMRVLLVLLIVALIVLGVLGYLDYLTWKKVAIAAGVSILVWLIGSFVTFVTTQRNLFAELNRRQEAQTQADVWARNLGFATLDLQRLSTAYAQHLAWSRALGAVLVRPFGEPSAKTPRAVLSDDGLPLGVRLGVASPEPAVVANAVAVVRRGTFRSGWLTGPWDRHVEDAPRLLGPDGIDLEGDPGQLYSARGGDHSLLDRWVNLVSSTGPTAASADDVWRQMNLPASPQADRLVERVTVGQAGATLTRDAFMGGIDGAAGAAPARPFDGALFTAESRTGERNAARDRWARSARTGLSQVSVLVEFTEGLGTFELAGLGSAEDQRHVPTDEPVF